jgi:hypothetical protein
LLGLDLTYISAACVADRNFAARQETKYKFVMLRGKEIVNRVAI